MPFIHVLKSSAATVSAWLVAGAIFPDRFPTFAAMAAIFVVQPSVHQSLGKAVERSSGVIVGVLLATGISLLFGDASWIVLIAIVLAMFTGWALRLTQGVSNQIPISAMLVLSIGAATPTYEFERIVETIIGATIGIIVNLAIVPPVHVQPVRDRILEFGSQIATELLWLANGLTVDPGSVESREPGQIAGSRAAASAAIAVSEGSLTLNPRRSKHRRELGRLVPVFTTLQAVSQEVDAMTLSMVDHYDETLFRDPAAPRLAERLRAVALSVEQLVARVEDPTEPRPLAPTLVPLHEERLPTDDHWVLIGAVTESLRRAENDLQGTGLGPITAPITTVNG
jgi:uncharacterized membrane protein YccC